MYSNENLHCMHQAGMCALTKYKGNELCGQVNDMKKKQPLQQ